MADNATIVGESTKIVGDLSGDEDLNVFGTVEGAIRLTQSLFVERSGVVRANVAVRSAVVSGVVIGNIAASEAVELTAEGRMFGDITAPRVIIADGAAFKGHIDMAEVDLANPPIAQSDRGQPSATPTPSQDPRAATSRSPSRPSVERTPAVADRTPPRPTVDRTPPPRPAVDRTPLRPIERPAPVRIERPAEATPIKIEKPLVVTPRTPVKAPEPAVAAEPVKAPEPVRIDAPARTPEPAAPAIEDEGDELDDLAPDSGDAGDTPEGDSPEDDSPEDDSVVTTATAATPRKKRSRSKKNA